MYKKAQASQLDSVMVSAAVSHMTICLLSFLSRNPSSRGGGIFIFYEDFPFGSC
jgi:hypothetical protein